MIRFDNWDLICDFDDCEGKFACFVCCEKVTWRKKPEIDTINCDGTETARVKKMVDDRKIVLRKAKTVFWKTVFWKIVTAVLESDEKAVSIWVAMIRFSLAGSSCGNAVKIDCENDILWSRSIAVKNDCGFLNKNSIAINESTAVVDNVPE